MDDKIKNSEVTDEKPKSTTFTKKIGRTTYVVDVHFSETSKETMEDKIKRLIINEIRNL